LSDLDNDSRRMSFVPMETAGSTSCATWGTGSSPRR
jgi:hypothetical protein